MSIFKRRTSITIWAGVGTLLATEALAHPGHGAGAGFLHHVVGNGWIVAAVAAAAAMVALVVLPRSSARNDERPRR